MSSTATFSSKHFFPRRAPAGTLLAEAAGGSLSLYLSEKALEEVADVIRRPHLVAKLKYDPQRVAGYVAQLRDIGTLVDNPPHVFDLPRDPDNEHYVDLAVAAKASLIVSHDKDLLELRDRASERGRDFLARFPDLSILTPPEALQLVRSR